MLYLCKQRLQNWSEGDSVTPILEPLTVALQKLVNPESSQENINSLVLQIRSELTYTKILLFLASVYDSCVQDYSRSAKHVMNERIIDRVYKKLLERQNKNEEAMKGFLFSSKQQKDWNTIISTSFIVSHLMTRCTSLLSTSITDSLCLLLVSYLAPVYYHMKDYVNAVSAYQKLIMLSSACAADHDSWFAVAQHTKSQSECFFALNRLGAALRTIDATLELLVQKCGIDVTPIVTVNSSEIEKCWLECILLKSEVSLSFQINFRLCVALFSLQMS